jgi:hypothetical protein
MSGPDCDKCGEHCVDCTCIEPKNPIGRPYITINWERVDELLEGGSSGLEIAADIGVNRDTLYDRTLQKYGMSFSDYSAMKHSKGEGKIRLAQYKKAIGESKKGDTQLLLFLGRVRLKQVEAQPEKAVDRPPNEDVLLLKDENIRLRHELRKGNAS